MNNNTNQSDQWDSSRLIGRVRERFRELIEKGWDWRSFYSGWLEGRSDMFAQIFMGKVSADQPVGKMCRWVKASERMPDHKADVVIKFDEYSYQIGNVAAIKDLLENGWMLVEWLEDLPQPSHVSGSSEKEAMKIGYKAGCIHGQRVGTNEGVLEAFEIWYGKILEIRAGGTPEITMDMIPVYPKKRNVSDEEAPEEKSQRYIPDRIAEDGVTEAGLRTRLRESHNRETALTRERDEYLWALEKYEASDDWQIANHVLNKFRSL